MLDKILGIGKNLISGASQGVGTALGMGGFPSRVLGGRRVSNAFRWRQCTWRRATGGRCKLSPYMRQSLQFLLPPDSRST